MFCVLCRLHGRQSSWSIGQHQNEEITQWRSLGFCIFDPVALSLLHCILYSVTAETAWQGAVKTQWFLLRTIDGGGGGGGKAQVVGSCLVLLERAAESWFKKLKQKAAVPAAVVLSCRWQRSRCCCLLYTGEIYLCSSSCPPSMVMHTNHGLRLHCKKRLAIFPSSAGKPQTKLYLAGKNFIIPGQGEFG